MSSARRGSGVFNPDTATAGKSSSNVTYRLGTVRVDRILQKLAAPVVGIKLVTHDGEQCFKGSDLMNWLVKNLLGWEHSQCVHFVESLLKDEFLVCLDSHPYVFKNRKYFQLTVDPDMYGDGDSGSYTSSQESTSPSLGRVTHSSSKSSELFAKATSNSLGVKYVGTQLPTSGNLIDLAQFEFLGFKISELVAQLVDPTTGVQWQSGGLKFGHLKHFRDSASSKQMMDFCRKKFSWSKAEAFSFLSWLFTAQIIVPCVPAVRKSHVRGMRVGPQFFHSFSNLVLFRMGRTEHRKYPRVVIVGGGLGGAALAKLLDSHRADVTLVDPKEYYENPLRYVALIREVRVQDSVKLVKKAISRHTSYLKHVNIVQGMLKDLTDEKCVLDTTTLFYDYLIIATGCTYSTPQLSSARAASQAALRYDQAKTVLIVGGGCVGVELCSNLAEEYPDVKFTLAHETEQLLPIADAKAGKVIRKVLMGRGVEVLLNTKVEFEKQEETSVTMLDVTSGKKTTRMFDEVTWCTGGTPNSSFLAKSYQSALDEKGYIKVDENFRVQGFENVFAIGDVTNLPETKSGHRVYVHADYVAHILHDLRYGKRPMSKYKPAKNMPAMPVSLGANSAAMIIHGKYATKGIIPLKAKKGTLMLTNVEKSLPMHGQSLRSAHSIRKNEARQSDSTHRFEDVSLNIEAADVNHQIVVFQTELTQPLIMYKLLMSLVDKDLTITAGLTTHPNFKARPSSDYSAEGAVVKKYDVHRPSSLRILVQDAAVSIIFFVPGLPLTNELLTSLVKGMEGNPKADQCIFIHIAIPDVSDADLKNLSPATQQNIIATRKGIREVKKIFNHVTYVAFSGMFEWLSWLNDSSSTTDIVTYPWGKKQSLNWVCMADLIEVVATIAAYPDEHRDKHIHLTAQKLLSPKHILAGINSSLNISGELAYVSPSAIEEFLLAMFGLDQGVVDCVSAVVQSSQSLTSDVEYILKRPPTLFAHWVERHAHLF
eukprot:TRINITY_DN11310_c0_g1_i1.p1 TRINITY_DN11310_c0_g1~~TRINITY_DN11310_c0_g1_i1.p1  ORF type:complete len:990 (-),score=133.37 TRINITY_DN11310_c0_g1_i1:84-3053(-)